MRLLNSKINQSKRPNHYSPKHYTFVIQELIVAKVLSDLLLNVSFKIQFIGIIYFVILSPRLEDGLLQSWRL